MLQLASHFYEEIRDVVVDILLGRKKVGYEPNQFGSPVTGVGEAALVEPVCTSAGFSRRRTSSCSQHPAAVGDGSVEPRAARASRPSLDCGEEVPARQGLWIDRHGFVIVGARDRRPRCLAPSEYSSPHRGAPDDRG